MTESRVGNMRKGLLDLVAYVNGVKATKGLTLVEVGTYKGDSAMIFAQYFAEVTCVDAWEAELFNVPHEDVAEAEQVFDARAKAAGNVRKVKSRSLVAARLFPPRSFDVVYIDASHDYESVKADILAWRDKARLLVCGHDHWPSRFPGVVRAVVETVGKPLRVFADTSWVVGA